MKHIFFYFFILIALGDGISALNSTQWWSDSGNSVTEMYITQLLSLNLKCYHADESEKIYVELEQNYQERL